MREQRVCCFNEHPRKLLILTDSIVILQSIQKIQLRHVKCAQFFPPALKRFHCIIVCIENVSLEKCSVQRSLSEHTTERSHVFLLNIAWSIVYTKQRETH